MLAAAQVFGCHAKAPGSDLLDRRTGGVAIPEAADAGESLRAALGIHIVKNLETGRVLTTLAAVALAADAVHRHRQHLVGFPRQRAEAHATGAETLAEAFCALHLIQGQRRWGQLELQQISKRRDRPVLQQGFVGGEMVVARPGLHRRMQGLGHVGTVEVVLAAGAVLHKAHELELAAVELREGLGMK